MIVAFAGRRIDAEGTGEPGKFPLANVDRVNREVDQFLRERQPAVVVGSAACGADLMLDGIEVFPLHNTNAHILILSRTDSPPEQP